MYLTADAEATVQSFDPSKVYVIGGIVDRNRLKGRTMQKALDQARVWFAGSPPPQTRKEIRLGLVC